MKPYALICVTLVAADQLLKGTLPTPYWGWHEKDYTVASTMMAVALCLILVAYVPVRIAGTLLLAGLAGNTISAFRGPVANPFVVGDLAFNSADIMLYAGFAAIVACFPAVAHDIRKRATARGWK